MNKTLPSRVLLRAWMKRGWLACLLWPASVLYGAVVALRHSGFKTRLLKTHRLPVPVVVVGNLIVGGAGKTPCVLALVRLLQHQGWTVGLISRGYGRREEDVGIVEVLENSPASQVGDEPLLLKRRAQVPVFVGRRRVDVGRALLRTYPQVNLVVSDDGLQHRALERDVEIIVFDERGAGNGWLLPAGPLREPLPRGLPPRSLVLYNAPTPSTDLPGHLGYRSLQGVATWEDWRSGHKSSRTALDELGERSQSDIVVAAAGIAQPERFFELLRHSGVKIFPLPLSDHHDFESAPALPCGARVVIVTEKDAVKLKPAAWGEVEVWVAPLDFTMAPSVAQALNALLPQHPPDDSIHPKIHGHSTA